MSNIELNTKNLELLRQKFGIVGSSERMLESIRLLMQAAPTDLSVLITGETGTGKEVFAQALHGLSERRRYPFISVNCGAIPETLLESELFGHEKGAFTSANESRKGFFEVAHRSTIFLDEIGEMPYSTQVKLLRVLESGEFSRLGSSEVKKVDVRLIAATNRDLEQEVANGNFRQDLFFRLKSVRIVLSPLREHSSDVEALVDYFAGRVCEKLSIVYEGFSHESLDILKSLPWPGNVRELKNLIETIITLEKSGHVTPQLMRKYIPAALPAHESYNQPKEVSLVPLRDRDTMQKFEYELIFRTLLELKNDTTEIKRRLNNLEMNIDLMKIDIFNIHDDVITDNVNSASVEIVGADDLTLSIMEKKLIESALRKFDGNRRLAAQALGVSERTLYRKLTDYKLS